METTFPGMFERRARRDPQRRALTFAGRTWSYAEVLEEMQAFAGGLAARGVRRGDRVVYSGLNHASLPITLLAVTYLGAVFVPVDPRLTSTEWTLLLDDLRPALAVADESARPALEDAVGTSVPLLSVEGVGPDSIAGVSADHPPRREPTPVDAEALAVILYTSGSTGRPKGVLQSHRMMLANTTNLGRMLGIARDDVGLVMTPMFHTAGLNTSMTTLWVYGAEVVVLPRMDGPAVLDAIQRYGVTRIDTVTAALAVLVDTPGFASTDLSSIRSIEVGGAAIPAEHVEPFRRHGAQVYMAMGMTECCVSVYLDPEKLSSKPGSVGQTLALHETRIVDLTTGLPVTTPGQEGELRLRGPSVTTGYWNNPEATRAAFDDQGWYRTGDIVRADADGDLYMVGRVKDIIKTGGEGVAAAEVERVVAAHPAVLRCAVVGAPDERWGETVVAAVELRPGSALELAELRAFCEGELARFKLPTRLVIVDELPMTASGKIAKGAVREYVANMTPRADG